MREYRVYPSKVRGLGNVISNLNESDFECVKCRISKLENLQQNNIEIPMFQIELQGISVLLTISGQTSVNADEETELTANIIRKDNNNPVEGVDVYFYENNVLLGSAETNNKGNAIFNYQSNEKGVHTIVIKTFNQLEYDSTLTNIEIYIYKDTALSLSVEPTIPDILEEITLTTTLTDENNTALAGKTVDFYNGETLIGYSVTDDNGVATLMYNPEE